MASASKLAAGRGPANLPRGQDSTTRQGPIANLHGATPAIRPHQRRYCGPATASTGLHRFTRWSEAVPLKGTDTETCARALVFHWIARFGMPLDMTLDRGSQFMSKLWTAIAKLLGTKLHHTTAYHPQANCLVEHFYQNLKSALQARLTGPNWLDELL